MKIPITKSVLPEKEDFMNEISDLWDSRWLTNNGVKVRKLKHQLEHYLGIENVSLFCNGHLALESLLQAYDFKGEVITTPFTFASTTHAIIRNQLTPVFCDIKIDDFTIDPEKIEELINENTVAILPVHVYGNICDYEKIEKIAKKHKLVVIYDAAHAFGMTVDGINISCLGDASMFSFHATKVFHTIEGGAITTNDNALIEKLEKIKNFGILDSEHVDLVGTNAKMNEFQAAMGVCNLKTIQEVINKRKLICNRYIENLKEIKGIITPTYKKNIEYNYSYFAIIVDNYKSSRDELYQKLEDNGVLSRKYFYPLTSDFLAYKKYNFNQETPIASYIANKVLTLPLYPDMNIEDVDYVCSIIRK